MDKRTKKILSLDAALLRLRKYCAFTERSMAEVKKKLVGFNVSHADTEIAIECLIKQGFIDEERFASGFARGKFRIKKWGKRKIEVEMRKKGVSEELIDKGLQELPQEEYLSALDELLKKKIEFILRSNRGTNDFETKQRNRQKLIRYVLQKGYELDVVMERVKQLHL